MTESTRTIKIYERTHPKLRVLAALSGETILELVERLATAEQHRIATQKQEQQTMNTQTEKLFKVVGDKFTREAYLTTLDEFYADCERLAEHDDDWDNISLRRGITDGRECYRDEDDNIALIEADEDDLKQYPYPTYPTA